MIQALRNAIYVTGQTVTGLSSTNLFFHRIRENTALPYCVFDSATHYVERDSATDYENHDVQFIIYSQTLTGVETLAAALKVKFDYGKSNLSVSGYNVIESVRTFEIGATKIDNIWNMILQYRISISKSR